MKNIAFFPLFALLLCIAGCSQTAKQHPEGFKVYQVNLDEKVDPFKEIFSKAEVIPLETADSGLIIYMNKVFPVGDEYFIHEREVHKLYVFGKDGKYKRRISRYGQGPNDYISMFDCVVDAPNNDIYMLGVFGQVKRFDINGSLKCNLMLPARPHYYSMELVNDSCFATWSCLEPDEDCILVLHKETLDTINSFWRDDRMFNHQQLAPFHRLGNKTFYANNLRQKVLEVSPSGLIPAYLWDFGKYNMESRLDYYLSLENPNDRNNAIIDEIGTPTRPFSLEKQDQNHKFSYASLQRELEMRPLITHVFYDKEKDKDLVFDYLAEGCELNYPLYMDDDCFISDIYYDKRETYKSILPESEYKKLEAMKEDDNPCLLKLYFKK